MELGLVRDWSSDVFFFQAEDGIRDYDVTGVQTCALPIYFDQGKYRMAIKNLSRLLLHDDFVDIGKSFQLKIYIASLIIRFELGDFDTLESRLKYILRIYKEVLSNEDFSRDTQLIEIISKLIYCNNLQQDKKLLAKINADRKSTV